MALSPDAFGSIMGQARQPRGMVKVGGNVIQGWLDFEVDENAFREADTFRVTLALSALQAPYDEVWFASQTTMQVEVLAGLPADPNNYSSSDLDSLIIGNVDEVQYSPGDRTITLSGRDLTSLLIDAKTAEKWNNQTPSQIATTLANRHGLTPNVTPVTGLAGGFYQIDHAIPTQGQTEWDLLCWLAQQVGYVVYVDGNTLNFCPPPNQESNPYPITWQAANSQQTFMSNATRIGFSRTLTVGKTVSVTVRSWNQQQRKAFSVSYPSGAAGKIKPGRATSPAQPYTYIIPNLTKDQAEKRAAAIYNDIIKNEMRLSADMPADNVLDVMHSIPVTGTGTVFDQTYYPESIQRRMSFDGGYRMTISAKNHSDELEPAEA